MPSPLSPRRLPPLEAVFPDFSGMRDSPSLREQVEESLQKLIHLHQTPRNQVFYSVREIARFFGVSFCTARNAVEAMVEEGVLRRMRGSQTVLLGSETISGSLFRAVVGMPLWIFAQRFSQMHSMLAQQLGDRLWPHQIAFDLVPHYDIGEIREDLFERLHRHRFDFVFWHLPFSHHRDCILRLQDCGVRPLITAYDLGPSPLPADLIIGISDAFRNTFRSWIQNRKIRKSVVISPREFPARAHLSAIVDLAREEGMDCEIVQSKNSLARQLSHEFQEPIGIILPDEHSTAEFVFYDPPAFTEAARKHRVLFGCNTPNIPFIPSGELTCEKIQIESKGAVVNGIVNILSNWCSRDFGSPPLWTHSSIWLDCEMIPYI